MLLFPAALIALSACDPETIHEPSEAQASHVEASPIDNAVPQKTGTIDLNVSVLEGIIAFPDAYAYLSAIQTLNNYEEAAVVAWAKSHGVATIQTTVEDLDIGLVSYDNLSDVAKASVTFHELTGDPLLSSNVALLSHKVRSPEGMVIVGDKIGYADRWIQVWAPLHLREELQAAVRDDNFDFHTDFEVVQDYRSERGNTSLVARGSNTVDAPSWPWPSDNSSTGEHTNVNDDRNRRCRSEWTHEQEVIPYGTQRLVAQGLVLSGYSYKRSFGYKTNHTYRYFFGWMQNDGSTRQNNERLTESRSKTKRFSDAFLYHSEVVPNRPEELARASTRITDLGVDDGIILRGYHTHRGMGSEFNILVER